MEISLIKKALTLNDEYAFEISRLKQSLCSLEERIYWKRQEIEEMQEEIERLFELLNEYEWEEA